MNSAPNYYRVFCDGTYIMDFVGTSRDDVKRQLHKELEDIGFDDVFVNWQNKKFNVKDMTIEPWITDTTPPLQAKTQ